MAAAMDQRVRLPEEDAQPACKHYSDHTSSEAASDDEKLDEDEVYNRESDGDRRDEGNFNAGWAEAMAKILGKKTSESKGAILVRNKQLENMRTKEREKQLENKIQVDKRRAWEMMCRQKPDMVKDRETERGLQRIATRGVVQLFNAVRKHQKTMEHKMLEVGGSERKKAKILSSVSRKDFIDVLRRNEGCTGVSTKTKTDAAAAAKEKPAWSVLTDDFMMGANMKDWDKDSDGGEAASHAGQEVEGGDCDELRRE